MKLLITLYGFLISCYGLAQYQVLHYQETSGYDHQTRANSLILFQQLGSLHNFTVMDDATGSEFNNLNDLLNYDLIVFSNTSGDNILDGIQRNNFEQYIQNGGAFLGIHAASDTYRHSSANGSSTGSWDFYAQTLGGSVQQNPNHVAGTPLYSISKIGMHASTANLPNPWMKNEEYYYWENGYLDPSIHVVLEVEQTIGPNNLVNSYDSSRAVAWHKTLSSNSNVFYTSLGHTNSDFTSDTLFQKLIEDATLWCLGLNSTMTLNELNEKIQIYPNPTSNQIKIQTKGLTISKIEIIDIPGVTQKSKLIDFNFIDISNLSSGIYHLKIQTESGMIIKNILKE